MLELTARQLDQLELETLFSGEYDFSDAIVSLHPGAGGLESQDWAEMPVSYTHLDVYKRQAGIQSFPQRCGAAAAQTKPAGGRSAE